MLAQLGQFLFQGLQAVLGSGVFFLLERLALDFELHDAAFELVDLDGHAVDLHAQAAGGFVDEVDGLVGQEAVGDVAVGELGGLDERAVLDAHAVMGLVALLEATQDGDGVFHGRLVHEHGLEAPRERGILFDVLAVFVQGGRAHAAQLAAGERGLDHVGSVDGAFGLAGADEGMQLVDEQHDGPGAVDHFLDERLEAVLEFAAVLRAGEHRAEVERHHALVLEAFGHVAGHDAPREAFGDGRLAHAGLADQHGIVLGAARENLDDAADFRVAADDGIQLAPPGVVRQVAAVLLERLVLVFGRFVGHAPAAAHALQGLEHGLDGDAEAAGDLGDLAGLAAEGGQEEVFRADVVVLHLRGELGGRFEGGLQVAGDAAVQAFAFHLRAAAELAVEHVGKQVGLDADLLQHGGHDAAVLPDEGQREMEGIHFGMAALLGETLGVPEGFLGFGGPLVGVHGGPLPFRPPSIAQPRRDFKCRPRSDGGPVFAKARLRTAGVRGKLPDMRTTTGSLS